MGSIAQFLSAYIFATKARIDNRKKIVHVIPRSMPFDPIQGQDQGHGAFEFPKIALFQVYLLRHLQSELANDS